MHEQSKTRLLGGTEGPQLLALFERLVDDAIEMKTPCLDLVITYIDEGDEFVAGSYIPEMHLVIRKVDD